MPTFTPNQYQHLMKLIDKDVASKDMATNMAGTSHRNHSILHTFNACFSIGTDTIPWIMDIGSMNHMVSNLNSLLHSISIPPNSSFVHLPNGRTTTVSHTGSIVIFYNSELQDVLYIPHFAYNLLSISKLIKELNYCVSFYPSFYLFQDLCTCKVRGIGKKEGGLCMLPSTTKKPTPVKALHSSCSTFDSYLSIWHMRLGHAPIVVLHKIDLLKSCKQHKDFSSCLVFPLARQTRFPFPSSVKKSISPFELLHMDVWGPYKQCTYNGHRFFLTSVDDYSRMTWVYLMRFKSEVITFITSFLDLVKT